MRNVGHTLEEQLRNEAEAVLSMWLRRDSHAIRSPLVQRTAKARAAEPRPLTSPRAGVTETHQDGSFPNDPDGANSMRA